MERLGPEGTAGLLALLDATRRTLDAEVTEQAVNRFERRLTTETSQLRVELKQEMNNLRVGVTAVPSWTYTPVSESA